MVRIGENQTLMNFLAKKKEYPCKVINSLFLYFRPFIQWDIILVFKALLFAITLFIEFAIVH